MLVLSRNVRPNRDTIHISGPCKIVVVKVRGDRVELGIEAEPHVKIVRGELLDPPEEKGDAA